jgi:hypothetical protein
LTRIPNRVRDFTLEAVSSLRVGSVGYDLLGSGSVKVCNTAIVVNGLARKPVDMEPPIGHRQEFARRCSGFLLSKREYAQILRLLITETKDLVLDVLVYDVSRHSSHQKRVRSDGGVHRYVKPDSVGFAVVFLPWVDKEANSPTPGFYCVQNTHRPKVDPRAPTV